MKLIVFRKNGTQKLGIVTDSGVLDVFGIQASLKGMSDRLKLPDSVAEFYSNGLAFLPALHELLAKAQSQPGEWWLDESTLDIAPIVPSPGKVLCVGLNYRRHAAEAGMAVPESPVLFAKFNNAIAACNDVVLLSPDDAKECDYEAELVVIMGADANNVSEADALNYVLGYCNGNDISARDLQFRTSQWMLGKTMNNFLPIGPYLVTADDVPDPQTLAIKTWYNGELRQNSSTQDMVFSVAEIVSYFSRYIGLQPGDITATGTPEGVIHGDDDPQWMKPGDRGKAIEYAGKFEESRLIFVDHFLKYNLH